MKKKSGFSVVELLIVLTFISILVFVSMRISDSVTANSRITGLINNFLADFSQAKLLAAAENRYVSIIFSPNGNSYTIQKQTDISDYATWTLVKTVRPFNDKIFYNLGDVSDFAINSTGEVRNMPINIANSPTQVTLVFYVLNNRGAVDFTRTIRIFPYGGLKVEKK
jgi:Tfp pilus assembly protein FimT